MHGNTPNNREFRQGNPAEDYNKNGSESGGTNPTADKNINPAKNQKRRKTDAEILAGLKERLQKIADKKRKVNSRLAKTRRNELLHLKRVIGDSCLNYLAKLGPFENEPNLVKLLRNHASDCDKAWVASHFDRLLKEHIEPKTNQSDSNGESPSSP